VRWLKHIARRQDGRRIESCWQLSQLPPSPERLRRLMTDHFWGHFFREGYSPLAARLLGATPTHFAEHPLTTHWHLELQIQKVLV